MTHPDSDNIATIERELEAVDAALRGGSADHHDPFMRELQELGLLLEAEAPEPRAEFAGELEKRMREGFPAPPGSARALGEEVRSGLAAAAVLPPGAPRRLPSPEGVLPAPGALL